MNRPFSLFVVLLGGILVGGSAVFGADAPAVPAPAPTMLPPLNADRIHQLEALVSAGTTAFAPKVDDRVAWDALAQQKAFADVVAKAATLIDQPLPELTDDLYLEYTKNGNRTHYQDAYFEWKKRLNLYFLAEMLENKGRFLPAIDKLVAALCARPTWVLPAHDPKLVNFKGEAVEIDLFSSETAADLSQALYVLGAKLSPQTRQLMSDNIHRRVVDPFRQTIEGKRLPEWWFLGTNNWNGVCLGNTLTASLAVLDKPADRALYIAAAEEYSLNLLKGFSPDGYCLEGLGYWGYGFGHYVQLSEDILKATKGQVDLLSRPLVREIALFPARLMILNGVYPAYGDAEPKVRPSAILMAFLNLRLGLGLTDYPYPTPPAPTGPLADLLMYTFPNSATEAKAQPAAASPLDPLRGWFPETHILSSRPAPGSACRFGVSLKGGYNGVSHGHNDLGTFVCVLGKEPVLLDPGGEVYTARTFSPHRFDSKLLNSYGHPVPVIGGVLQKSTTDASAGIVKTDFTDARDTLVMDLRSAYDVPELQKLERTFVYSREGEGSLTVKDQVELSAPKTFSTAFITFGSWKQLSADSFLVSYDDEVLRITIDTGGIPFDLTTDTINEDGHNKTPPLRIAVTLRQPVTQAVVTAWIAPNPAH